MWHAKAVHTCCCFLPKESPLLIHIQSSYLKHHLRPKLKEKEEIERKRQIEEKKLEEERKIRMQMLEQQCKDKIIKNFGLNHTRNRNLRCK